MRGFKTRNFRNVTAYHRRVPGSARGLCRGKYSAGHAAYYVGYSQLFALARAGRHLLDSPLIIGSVMFLVGFYSGFLYQLPQVADRQLIAFVRREQLRRLTFRKSVWQ